MVHTGLIPLSSFFRILTPVRKAAQILFWQIMLGTGPYTVLQNASTFLFSPNPVLSKMPIYVTACSYMETTIAFILIGAFKFWCALENTNLFYGLDWVYSEKFIHFLIGWSIHWILQAVLHFLPPTCSWRLLGWECLAQRAGHDFASSSWTGVIASP